MKKRYIYIIIAILIGLYLSACDTQPIEPFLTIERPTNIPSSTATRTSTPTDISEPTATSTNTPKPTNTLIPSKTFTITPIPSPTYTPYPTKQVILDYSVSGWHGLFESYLDWSASILVLYSDGQMILTGKPDQQKILSAGEMEQFLSQVEDFGFYELETNQQHDQTDQLYDFGDQYQRVYDGLYYCVLVTVSEERNICIHDPSREFIVPEMKNVLEFLDNYQPQGMTPYYSDRVLLYVQVGRNPYDDNLPGKAIPWSAHLPSLETPDQKVMYFEGEIAAEIYALVDNAISGSLFTQNGIEYTVYIETVLPHEEVRQP